MPGGSTRFHPILALSWLRFIQFCSLYISHPLNSQFSFIHFPANRILLLEIQTVLSSCLSYSINYIHVGTFIPRSMWRLYTRKYILDFESRSRTSNFFDSKFRAQSRNSTSIYKLGNFSLSFFSSCYFRSRLQSAARVRISEEKTQYEPASCCKIGIFVIRSFSTNQWRRGLLLEKNNKSPTTFWPPYVDAVLVRVPCSGISPRKPHSFRENLIIDNRFSFIVCGRNGVNFLSDKSLFSECSRGGR